MGIKKRENRRMTNAEKFQQIFNLYATELWALPEKDFLKWLNTEIQPEKEKKDTISRQAAIEVLNKLVRDNFTLCDAFSFYLGALHDAADGIKALPSAQSEIIYCKDCKHRPKKNADYDDDSWDCGFNIEFPDYRCPCQCEDGYYNTFPEDDWFCGNGDRKEERRKKKEE